MSDSRGQRTMLGLAFLFLLPSALLAALPRLSLPENPSPWFVDGQGRGIYLAGAHDGWELQDFAWGDTFKEQPFAWAEFLDCLATNHHNVMRLWVVEHTRINDADEDSTSPMPYVRVSGSEPARDGGDRFDLDRFNEDYFARLRQRVGEAQDRGLYVIVMLFQGWSIDDKGGKVNPWPYHPFHAGNNVNGVNGDLDGDGQGSELHTWLGEDHDITERQRAYVNRVVEAVGAFDHVLFEVANESHTASMEWQNRMVDYVHQLGEKRSMPYLVGMTVPFGGARRPGLNRELLASRADWISPNRQAGRAFNYRDNPPPALGTKVVLLDSDHLHGNKLRDYHWVWKSFCRGYHVLFMDRWTEERDDLRREEVRRAIGVSVDLSRELDLRVMRPDLEAASTRFCLAHPGGSYVVYQPEPGPFHLDLPTAAHRWDVTWIDPRSGTRKTSELRHVGGRQNFEPPWPHGAVLHVRRWPEDGTK